MPSDEYHGYDDEPLSTEHLGDGDEPATDQATGAFGVISDGAIVETDNEQGTQPVNGKPKVDRGPDYSLPYIP